MARLEVRDLSRAYEGEAVALQGASFTVEDGRIAALLGPSGSGKTTTLRLVAGLDRPDAGDVLLDGRSILAEPPDRRGVGLMFQDLALFPHMDVRANVSFGLRMKGWPARQRDERVAELLAVVGLGDKARRRVHELSGGEQQRVALARTLAPQPAVLLLDEPLGSLDEALKQSLRHEVRDLLKRLETTAVIVTHDRRDAVAIADDLVLMDEGRVLQAGPLPEVFASPESVRAAEMLGYVLLAAGPVCEGKAVEEGAGAVELPEWAEDAGRARAYVFAHPSTLLGVPAGSKLGCGVSGTVVRSRPEGPMHLLEVEVAGRRLEVRWEWDLYPPDDGATVELAARPETLRYFLEPVDEEDETARAPLEEPGGEVVESRVVEPDAVEEAEAEPRERPAPPPYSAHGEYERAERHRGMPRLD